ncbi:MAG: aminotransferase class V-fold PLP-dependent enzyme [Candidatus Peribacteria bacterium]|nr:MAG: aminotransferase class V-fold PLP-dependent enzyme [Candidatus Peribacteria bacterium]
MSMKEYFPIFENNPGLVYMDSTATSQKPRQVIDGVSEYLSHDYSNIHR